MAASAVIERLEWPQPRIALGIGLRGVASAAIDVSDGLAGDLGHVLKSSRLAATIQWDAVPRSQVLQGLDVALQQRCVFTGGDDYELLFAAPRSAAGAVEAAARAAGVAVVRIGNLQSGQGLAVVGSDGRSVDIAARAFDHFRHE